MCRTHARHGTWRALGEGMTTERNQEDTMSTKTTTHIRISISSTGRTREKMVPRARRIRTSDGTGRTREEMDERSCYAGK